MNVLVMYDRETGSLWSQLLGEAVEGSFKGTKLEFLPAVHTTWEDWKTQFPDTKALAKGYYGVRTSYARYYSSDAAGVIGETFDDDRLRTKQLVLGAEHNGEAVAYPLFQLIDREPVINDVIGGEPVLVVLNEDSRAAVVFSRVTEDGQTLTFSAQDGVMLADAETGSTWDGMRGLSTEGSLVGTQLEPLKSTISFWFGWKDFYPKTRVYGE